MHCKYLRPLCGLHSQSWSFDIKEIIASYLHFLASLKNTMILIIWVKIQWNKIFKWHFSLHFGQAPKAEINTTGEQYSQVILDLLSVWILCLSGTRHWPWQSKEMDVGKVGRCRFLWKGLSFPFTFTCGQGGVCSPATSRQMGSTSRRPPRTISRSFSKRDLPSVKAGDIAEASPFAGLWKWKC